MGRDADFEMIDWVVANDPSFATVPTDRIESALGVLRRYGSDADFIFAAMQCLALPMNGHTRLIPNHVIDVLPIRFVTLGTDIWLVDGDVEPAALDHRLIAINDQPIESLLSRWSPFLAGTASRKQVIGPLFSAWPAALARAGSSGCNGVVRYELECKGERRDLSIRVDRAGPAISYYPVSERGRLHADIDPYGVSAEFGSCLYLRLADFVDDTGYDAALSLARRVIPVSPKQGLVIDLRGNPGGDFLKRLDLIECLGDLWNGSRCAVLIDKFTFSAAIVFAALVAVRLTGRVRFFGETMGDGLEFYAEGGILTLPGCGAAVRYSNGHHDWATGKTTATTPADIVPHLVAAGQMQPDVCVWPSPKQLRHGDDPALTMACEWVAEGVS